MNINELNKRIKILIISLTLLGILICALVVVDVLNKDDNILGIKDPDIITDLGDINDVNNDVDFGGITFETDYGMEVIDLGDIGKRGTSLIHTTYNDNENEENEPESDIRPVVSNKPENPGIIEYVEASNSCQSIKYIVYAPYDADETTPVFLFMHGSSDLGEDYTKYISKYSFVRNLITGEWYPDIVIVCPILPKGTNWISQKGNLEKLLGEVVSTYGGSLDNMYVSGASLGANCLTSIAQSINFRGAIYMAGYLGNTGNTMSAEKFLQLWSGKSVYYLRDNLYAGGGYGYNKKYVQTCIDKAGEYNVRFIFNDLNWDHSVGLVDCALMPGIFQDSKGQCGMDALESIVNYDRNRDKENEQGNEQ